MRFSGQIHKTLCEFRLDGEVSEADGSNEWTGGWVSEWVRGADMNPWAIKIQLEKTEMNKYSLNVVFCIY